MKAEGAWQRTELKEEQWALMVGRKLLLPWKKNTFHKYNAVQILTGLNIVCCNQFSLQYTTLFLHISFCWYLGFFS